MYQVKEVQSIMKTRKPMYLNRFNRIVARWHRKLVQIQKDNNLSEYIEYSDKIKADIAKNRGCLDMHRVDAVLYGGHETQFQQLSQLIILDQNIKSGTSIGQETLEEQKRSILEQFKRSINYQDFVQLVRSERVDLENSTYEITEIFTETFTTLRSAKLLNNMQLSSLSTFFDYEPNNNPDSLVHKPIKTFLFKGIKWHIFTYEIEIKGENSRKIILGLDNSNTVTDYDLDVLKELNFNETQFDNTNMKHIIAKILQLLELI